MNIRAALALAAALLPALAVAHDAPPVVSDAYIRSTNPRSGGVYLAISNPRHDACALTAATTPAAQQAMLHSTRDASGVMSMTAEASLELPAEGSLVLQPGGSHIMLMGLTAPLKQGDSVPISLDFGPCGMVEVTVPVDNTRSEAPTVKPRGLLDSFKHH